MAESPVLGARGGLRALSRGLITYGIVGLIVAAIGFGSMVWVNGRISELRSEAQATVASMSTTVGLAAAVLRGASTSAQSFSGTVDQSAQAVSFAAGTITQVRSDLSALEAQLRSVSFLGTTPLASSADAIARIATSMDGLETQLPLISDSLRGNRDALASTAASLSELADSTAALAGRLTPDVGQDSLGEVQQVIAMTLLMFAAWSFVPAVGALAVGLSLRRELGRGRPGR